MPRALTTENLRERNPSLSSLFSVSQVSTSEETLTLVFTDGSAESISAVITKVIPLIFMATSVDTEPELLPPRELTAKKTGEPGPEDTDAGGVTP